MMLLALVMPQFLRCIINPRLLTVYEELYRIFIFTELLVVLCARQQICSQAADFWRLTVVHSLCSSMH
jgi:hypothetical protein